MRFVAPLLREVFQLYEKVCQLVHHAGGEFPIREHSARGPQSNVRRAAPALRGTDAQKRRLGDDGGVRVESLQTSGQRAIHAAELLVHDGFENQIAAQVDSQPLDRFDNEQVGAHATLHIIRPAAVDAIAFDLTAESAARPWLGAARNGIDMARE